MLLWKVLYLKLIHFELNFILVWAVDSVSFLSYFFLIWISNCSKVISKLNCLSSFVKNQLTIHVCVCFWTLMCSFNLYLDYCSFIIILKLDSVKLPTLSFLMKIVWPILVPLLFHIDFSMFTSTWLELLWIYLSVMEELTS